MYGHLFLFPHRSCGSLKKKKLYKAKSLPTNEQFEITNTKIELSNTGNVEKLHECLEGQELNLLKTVKVELIKKKNGNRFVSYREPRIWTNWKVPEIPGEKTGILPSYIHIALLPTMV